MTRPTCTAALCDRPATVHTREGPACGEHGAEQHRRTTRVALQARVQDVLEESA